MIEATISKTEYITIIIAVAGLVIAFVSLCWNIFLHVLSRPKIEVQASIMKLIPTPVGVDPSMRVLLISATNVRSRPVQIKAFCGKLAKPKNGEQLFINGSSRELQAFSTSLPKQLKEGDQATVMLLRTPEELEVAVFEIKRFFVTDTAGREWYSKKYPLFGQVKKTVDF